MRFPPTCQSRLYQHTRARLHSVKTRASLEWFKCLWPIRHPRVRARLSQEVLMVPAGPVRRRHARKSAGASHSEKGLPLLRVRVHTRSGPVLFPGEDSRWPPLWKVLLRLGVLRPRGSGLHLCWLTFSFWSAAASACRPLIGCWPRPPLRSLTEASSPARPDWSKTSVTSQWTLI